MSLTECNLYNEILRELEATNELLSVTNKLLSKVIAIESNKGNNEDALKNNLSHPLSDVIDYERQKSDLKSQQCVVSKPFYI